MNSLLSISPASLPREISGAKLGKARVEVRRGRGWREGTLVGRSYGANPRVDVMFDDRTVEASIPVNQIRTVDD